MSDAEKRELVAEYVQDVLEDRKVLEVVELLDIIKRKSRALEMTSFDNMNVVGCCDWIKTLELGAVSGRRCRFFGYETSSDIEMSSSSTSEAKLFIGLGVL